MLICLASESPLKKTNFFFTHEYQLEIASGLEIVACVHFLALGCRLAQNHAVSVLAASVCEEHSYVEQFVLYSGLQAIG